VIRSSSLGIAEQQRRPDSREIGGRLAAPAHFPKRVAVCDLPTMAFLRRLLIALCACTARAVLPMPLPPLLPMPALGPQIFNALPLMAAAGYGRGGASGPFGRGGYPLPNGPMPAMTGDQNSDENAFKRAAYLSGITSGLPARGARGQNLKRFYSCQQQALPGLIVPYGALRAMKLAN